MTLIAEDLLLLLLDDETLAARLVAAGLLERREDRVLGLFPRTRWPVADVAHEDDVRRRLSAALVQGLTPDERTGALVALLHAIGQAHKVVPHDGVSTSEVKRRAKEVSEGALGGQGGQGRDHRRDRRGHRGGGGLDGRHRRRQLVGQLKSSSPVRLRLIS